jgi:hypothetical protein
MLQYAQIASEAAAVGLQGPSADEELSKDLKKLRLLP